RGGSSEESGRGGEASREAGCMCAKIVPVPESPRLLKTTPAHWNRRSPALRARVTVQRRLRPSNERGRRVRDASDGGLSGPAAHIAAALRPLVPLHHALRELVRDPPRHAEHDGVEDEVRVAVDVLARGSVEDPPRDPRPEAAAEDEGEDVDDVEDEGAGGRERTPSAGVGAAGVEDGSHERERAAGEGLPWYYGRARRVRRRPLSGARGRGRAGAPPAAGAAPRPPRAAGAGARAGGTPRGGTSSTSPPSGRAPPPRAAPRGPAPSPGRSPR